MIPSELTPEGNIPTEWSVLKVSTANAEGKGAWLLIPSELTPQENTLTEWSVLKVPTAKTGRNTLSQQSLYGTVLF